MKKHILHVINKEKFTQGYINYMSQKISRHFIHHFIVFDNNSNFKITAPNAPNTLERINPDNHIFTAINQIKRASADADKIIITGIFGKIPKILVCMPKTILQKTYLQFWGGDFYQYRNIRSLSKDRLRQIALRRVIKGCAGIINLVPGDYEELSKFFPNNTPHFVASMPSDPNCRKVEFCPLPHNSKNCILLGNSATPENHHTEILYALKHLRNSDIQIYCPLSYGDKAYAQTVVKIGEDIFKEKFTPILDYIDLVEYEKILGSCKVGIFNNDRQQALGNIETMLKMGRKIYMRPGTSMWNCFKDLDIGVYPIDCLKAISCESLFKYTDDEAQSNALRIIAKSQSYAQKWKSILEL